MFSRLSYSLSFRLLVIFLVLGGLFVLGTMQAIQRFYNSDDIRGLISGHLSLHVHYVREDIGVPPDIERALAITRSVPVDIRISGPDIDWASDPAFPLMSALEFAPSPRFSDQPGAWVDELQGVEFAALDGHNFLKISQGGYDIVVSTPRIADAGDQFGIIPQILGLGLTFLLCAYFAVRWLFRPIVSIREGAAHIGRGNFDFRISKVRRDQLGDLAADINRLAGDVEGMLDAKRALLLGISHELRTPLSRMRLTLEFLDDEENAASLRTEIMEMEKIVASLLEAERLNARHANLNRTRVVVAELVAELLDDFFDRERDRITLLQPQQPVIAEIDEARVTLMLKNLVANALRYSKPGDGPVELSFEKSPGELVFRVRDHGPGMPSDHAARIGEPFYRGDPSRARSSGGTGLGLYLASLVAKAHGGKLALIASDSPGACFEIRLPIAD
ncbi:MAG: HAMP domain-containing sensor histidine kinase [Proteobacteria bacterium]|nr:HAMP domain-containing sensor histidine kinase [Pseudomonadota bacterium]